MKTIPLTKGYEALVDDEDYERLNKVKWHAHRSRNVMYVDYTTCHDQFGKQRTIKMHRMILNVPDGMQVDHIDGDGLNNQKYNLRIVTNRQNHMNRQWERAGRFPGITWERRRNHWVAQAQINGKHVYIGSFKTEEEAYAAYCRCVNPIEKIISDLQCPSQEKVKEMN